MTKAKVINKSKKRTGESSKEVPIGKKDLPKKRIVKRALLKCQDCYQYDSVSPLQCAMYSIDCASSQGKPLFVTREDRLAELKISEVRR